VEISNLRRAVDSRKMRSEGPENEGATKVSLPFLRIIRHYKSDQHQEDRPFCYCHRHPGTKRRNPGEVPWRIPHVLHPSSLTHLGIHKMPGLLRCWWI